MELLLWRWSTTAQIASALLIAAFFVVLGRSFRRVELRAWVMAWLANLGALAVTCIFWLAQPQSVWEFALLRWCYFFSKTMFVTCLVVGAATFVRDRVVPISRMTIAIVAIAAAVGAIVLNGISLIGTAQSAVIAILLGGGAVILFRNSMSGSRWLAAGFAVRALLALIETFSYATRVVPNRWSATKSLDIILASHSSFDTGAEWAIALGCVLMLHRKIQRELSVINEELVAAKEVLQGMVDRDSLTGLANRRAIADVFREVSSSGASVLFFDLNEFKEINDSYGHQTGDECLKRFAEALRSSFRPQDRVIRYAGDEFVVVAPGIEPLALANKLEVLRERLRFDRGRGPEIRFAVGSAYMPPGGSPDDAIAAADAAMYRDKAGTRGRRRSV